VERFGKIEMFNVECCSSLNSPPENVLAETDSYTHSTFRNLLIEGHIRVDSSINEKVSDDPHVEDIPQTVA